MQQSIQRIGVSMSEWNECIAMIAGTVKEWMAHEDVTDGGVDVEGREEASVTTVKGNTRE